MYCVIKDTNTKSYYMNPGDVAFHAYSDPELVEKLGKSSRVIETDIDDEKELQTMLYNAGFYRGYMDGAPIKISRNDIYYYDWNPNDIAYAQWQLTGDERFLEMIRKSSLVTLCKVDGETIYFPITRLPETFLEEGEEGPVFAVLAYTDPLRIPKILFDQYEGWRLVKMTFDARCVVNGAFVAT